MSRFWSDKRLVLMANAAVLLAIVGYGAFLRGHDLGVSLYDDEIYTRERAMQSARYTLESRDYPLYYLLAKASLGLGDTEAALRLPSFIAGLLGILAMYGLLRQVHSRTAGIVAAAIIAFSPFHIHYSTFARYYALMMLFAILTLWSLFNLLDGGRARAWIAYTISAFLALFSHVCFAPALAMLNVGAALYLLCDRSRGSVKRRAALVCLLALCTVTASGLMIQRNVHPAELLQRVTQPSAADTSTTAAASNAPAAHALTGAPAEGKETPVIESAYRPRGGGLEFVDAPTGETRFILTFYDCVEYLKTFFWNNTTWLWPLLIVLGVWGFVDLWFRVPALAAPLACGFLLAPLPLFLFPTDHWYHVRYLSYAYVFSLVFVAAGVCVLPRFISRILGAPRSIRLWRRAPDSGPARPSAPVNVLYSGIVVCLVAPLAPVMNEAYLTYPVDGYLPRGPLVENRVPVRDWQHLYRFVSDTVRDGDPFLFMMPDYEHGARYARYYFSRFLPWRDEEVRFHEQFGPPTPAVVHQFAQDYPMANLWFVGCQNFDAYAFAPFFGDAGALHLNLSRNNIPRGLHLYFLGAPTTNLIANGSFEGFTRAPAADGISKCRDDGYTSATSLQIAIGPEEFDGEKAWSRSFRIPVSPATYRLRNNGFDAWKDAFPVGWSGNGAAALSVSMMDAGFKETRSLKLAPAAEAVMLQQSLVAGLVPGRTLEVQAMGLSHTPDNLRLVLRWQGPGFQEELHTTHPGTGKWALMTMEAAIPANADPGTITIELWRMPGGEGDAAVDNVELRVKDAGASLDPEKPYVLSLAARTEGLAPRGGSDQVPAGRVRLTWVDANGVAGHTDLMKIHNDKDWRRLVAVFQPGIDIPASLKELYVEPGIHDGIGTLWIDQVQLEEGAQPTPYTESHRLPHDEAVAPRDLSAHVVAVEW